MVAGGCASGAAPGSSAASGAISSPAESSGPSPTATPAATFPMTLIDDEDHQVKLAAEPRRIVSLTPANTEIAFALGAGDRVIATTNFDDYPPAAVPLPDVATFDSVDVEKIVGLKADLVLAGGNNFNKPTALQQLRDLGIPVLVVYAADLNGVFRDMELIGTAIGREAQAKDLTASMRAQIDQIAAATAGLPHPRTFYEIDATKDIFGPADGSFIVELIKLAGGEPITTGSSTVFSIPLERLVSADPEVIVLGDGAYGTTPAIVKGRAGWSSMTAVKNGDIRPVDDIIVTRPGPRLVEGLRALTLAIHPDAILPGPSASPSVSPSLSPSPYAR
jgi:iron complex transport system substrate-binding protein